MKLVDRYDALPAAPVSVAEYYVSSLDDQHVAIVETGDGLVAFVDIDDLVIVP